MAMNGHGQHLDASSLPVKEFFQQDLTPYLRRAVSLAQ